MKPAASARPSITLHYRISRREQSGDDLSNPLFDLLKAVQTHGSISGAAEALTLSYRHVWGSLRQWEEELGHPLLLWTRGKKAQLSPYAQRLVAAESRARVRLQPHLEALRAELTNVLRMAEEEPLVQVDVAASHDPALGSLQRLARDERRLHLSLRYTGSEDALRSLSDGGSLLAGFHVPRLTRASPVFAQALRPLLLPGLHKLIGSHTRVQGWIHHPDRSPTAPLKMDRLRQPGVRFINRQAGSGTRLLLDHLLAEARLDPTSLDGYASRIEHTHVAVAAAIAAGEADVGLGVESAAREAGLAFEPLVEEDYYLACLKPALDTEVVARLQSLLSGPAWAAELARLPGTRPLRPGEVLSLTQALPWWQFGPQPETAQPTPASVMASLPG